MTDTPIRNAATIILVRDARTRPAVLMGQRGAGAVFMPMKFVFPGGAVDPGDAAVSLAEPLDPSSRARLLAESDGPSPEALATAAIRELWEEAGLVLGSPGMWTDPPADWERFAATGHRPSAAGLDFIFRAVTPAGKPRRFDARFFLAEAESVMGDPDDFSAASDELDLLQWIPLETVRSFDLPYITTVVVAEVRARVMGEAPDSVPFFRNIGENTEVLRL